MKATERQKEQFKIYHQKNREKILRRMRQYYAIHREELLRRNKQNYVIHREERLKYYKEHSEYYKRKWQEWYQKNKLQRKRYKKQYHQKNLERIRQWRKEYYQKNRKWILEKNKKHRKEHPEIWRVKEHRYHARKKNAEGSFTLEEWENLKKKYNYCCAICGRCEPEIKLTVDHIVPLSRGGTNYIENIQPLCKNCNSHKRDKIYASQKMSTLQKII